VIRPAEGETRLVATNAPEKAGPDSAKKKRVRIPQKEFLKEEKVMATIINHNLEAMNAYRNLYGTNNALAKSLERLSSGYRINRAADDAAGLAISEKMRAQISGLNAAQKNAQDGISLVRVAEGALAEVNANLVRMRELAVLASTDILTSTDRMAYQNEFVLLQKQVERITNTTEFNTRTLLNGAMSTAMSLDCGSTPLTERSARATWWCRWVPT